MAVSSNKLIPIAGVAGMLVIGGILYTNSSSKPAQSAMTQVPLPTTTGADQDTPQETLATVVQSNRELRVEVQKVIDFNKELLARLGDQPAGTTPASSASLGGKSNQVGLATTAAGASTPLDVIGNAWGNALDTAGSLAEQSGMLGGSSHAPATGAPGSATAPSTAAGALDTSSGAVGYKVLAPMGYTTQTKVEGGTTSTRYVRNPGAAPVASSGSATQAAMAAAAAAEQAKPADEPYYTLPENSTLAGVTAMTSIIGRVPINGRVTDPMQFKALIGRDNLAANGWELPEDLAGMVVTGIAIGDMALSCSEGKVRSITFVFNDGSIRTVSSRRSGSSASTGSSSASDLGFISDLHGNPCIQGKFVTNAPAYLTDILGAKSLGIAAEALAQAQTTVTTTGDSSQSSVTGNAGRFALGRMGSAATDELTRWLTERLKSSFDAVVTPAGAQLVVHLDQQVAIDKPANARKIVHRTQTPNVLSGARYGLE
ncbi:TIGR03752 family integrating conjugative element protein [Comamonas terrigena]|uniref:TIGR03752 family integrating conjugative element protein n=1 Tax=Comamonas terrigena TaxID=32013 RepID=UPI0028ADBC8D|nr:TIGR03752 family integrating conjugative element protein [Comamonas terrigena]